MTTLSFTGPAMHIPSAGRRAMGGDAVVTRTRLRMTRRGRRVLVLIAALPAVIALVSAMIGGGAALAGREDGVPTGGFFTVTVDPGDSLWTIAQDVAPADDPRDVVAAISRLNALDGAVLKAGQRLAIPAEYAGLP